MTTNDAAAPPARQSSRPVADGDRKAGARSESDITLLVLVSSGLLTVGAILYLVSLAALAFPGAFDAGISYGRIRPAAMSATMLGWLVVSFSAGAYYVLPRLTGSPLRSARLARIGGLATAGLAVIGIVTSLLGLSDGIEPFGFPWWLDIPVFIALAVPLVVTVRTVKNRTENTVYPTLWFVMAATFWLPVLYLVTNLPGLNSVARSLQAVTFTAGFTTLWVTAMGVGLAYYTTVKASDQPLAGRSLAQVGFWSLAFAATWSGPAQLVFGPTPDWLDALAAVFNLALPVAALANSYAISATVGTAWESLRERPSLLATLGGMGMAIFVGIATAVAGFRSSASLVALTTYWEGVLVAAIFGVGSLLVAGWVHQGIQAVTGLRMASPALAIRHIRLTAWGTTSTALLLMVGGVVTGVGWTGAGYTQSPAVGEGWGVTDVGQILIGLSVVTALVMTAGQVTLTMSIFRTITRGIPDSREILVPTSPEESDGSHE